jgi:hypothetical protein
MIGRRKKGLAPLYDWEILRQTMEIDTPGLSLFFDDLLRAVKSPPAVEAIKRKLVRLVYDICGMRVESERIELSSDIFETSIRLFEPEASFIDDRRGKTRSEG